MKFRKTLLCISMEKKCENWDEIRERTDGSVGEIIVVNSADSKFDQIEELYNVLKI